MQRTLVLVKPDGVQRGLTGEIISRIERTGLKMVGARFIHMDTALARRHYAVHEGKGFFQGLVQFITSGPIMALVFEGPSAVEVVRKTMGVTDPTKAAPGTIRGDLGIDIGRNLVHGSDSEETAQKEVALFFKPEDLVSYTRATDPWIVEPKKG
ncbi:MAG: nucleoside-diphosphate kinase [Chloroflexi bacterium]|nr:nucleoside-diphosphate kinase [Chloroflexota bacterium]